MQRDDDDDDSGDSTLLFTAFAKTNIVNTSMHHSTDDAASHSHINQTENHFIIFESTIMRKKKRLRLEEGE
jgi:hypothetical protein